MDLSRFKIKKGKIIYFILLVLFVFLSLGGFYRIIDNRATEHIPNRPSVTINGQTYTVELAKDEASQEKGLSGRKMLAESAGMLFVFPTASQYGFWMKDTLIPLDLIWISSDKHIVHIEQNVQPSSYPKVYSNQSDDEEGPGAALYVLELSANEAEKNHFAVGDQVSIFIPESH